MTGRENNRSKEKKRITLRGRNDTNDRGEAEINKERKSKT